MNSTSVPYQRIIADNLSEHAAVVTALSAAQPLLELIGQKLIQCLQEGKKVIFFGNGGSAADAQHLAAELVVRYRKNRRALPSIALTTDTSTLTACGNDFGFEEVYARQVEALGQPGDVAIGISTSGNSPNVVKGLQAAKNQGCVTIAFTAQQGGQCAEIADITFRAPSPVTARAQECHLLAGHILCELVESWLTQEG
jgi:D-sedoheptulose 7-phosphate isomerase